MWCASSVQKLDYHIQRVYATFGIFSLMLFIVNVLLKFDPYRSRLGNYAFHELFDLAGHRIARAVEKEDKLLLQINKH